MRRVAIVDCGGSGKSTLATQLGAKLRLPVHHLDRFSWRAGWREMPNEEWAALQRELCAQPEWIMDGNYGGTMGVRLAAADMIIFLDYPTSSHLPVGGNLSLAEVSRTHPTRNDRGLS